MKTSGEVQQRADERGRVAVDAIQEFFELQTQEQNAYRNSLCYTFNGIIEKTKLNEDQRRLYRKGRIQQD